MWVHDVELLESRDGEWVRRPLLCNIKEISQSEYFRAAAEGIQPAVCAIIKAIDYKGEDVFKLGDKLYTVYRIFKTGDNIELYGQRRLGGYGG